MIIFIISSIIIGLGIGFAVTNFTDIVKETGNGSIVWLFIGLVLMVVGVCGYYIANII